MKRHLMIAVLAMLPAGALLAQPSLNDGIQMLKDRKFPEAVGFFRQTVTLYPREAQAWMYLSRSYFANGQLDSAEFAGRKAVTFDDEVPDNYVALSQALIGQKKLGDANVALRAGLKQKKDNPALLMQLGSL